MLASIRVENGHAVEVQESTNQSGQLWVEETGIKPKRNHKTLARNVAIPLRLGS